MIKALEDNGIDIAKALADNPPVVVPRKSKKQSNDITTYTIKDLREAILKRLVDLKLKPVIPSPVPKLKQQWLKLHADVYRTEFVTDNVETRCPPGSRRAEQHGKKVRCRADLPQLGRSGKNLCCYNVNTRLEPSEQVRESFKKLHYNDKILPRARSDRNEKYVRYAKIEYDLDEDMIKTITHDDSDKTVAEDTSRTITDDGRDKDDTAITTTREEETTAKTITHEDFDVGDVGGDVDFDVGGSVVDVGGDVDFDVGGSVVDDGALLLETADNDTESLPPPLPPTELLPPPLPRDNIHHLADPMSRATRQPDWSRYEYILLDSESFPLTRQQILKFNDVIRHLENEFQVLQTINNDETRFDRKLNEIRNYFMTSVMRNQDIIIDDMRISRVPEVQMYLHDFEQVFLLFLLKQRVQFYNKTKQDINVYYDEWKVLVDEIFSVIRNIQDASRQIEKMNEYNVLLQDKLTEITKRMLAAAPLVPPPRSRSPSPESDNDFLN